jgi:hypothetical protein
MSMPAEAEAEPVNDEAADTADVEPVEPVPAVAPKVEVVGGAGAEVPGPSSDAASDAVLDSEAGSPEAMSMPAEAEPVNDEAADTADVEPVEPVPAVEPGVEVVGGAGAEVPGPSSDAASDAVLDSGKNKQEEQ